MRASPPPRIWGELLPAAAAMFTEEVGFDPIARYGDRYAARLRMLIAGQRSAIVTDVNGRIIFKADAGIVNLDVAQVQVYGCTRTTAATAWLSRSSCRRAASAAPIPALEPVRERLQCPRSCHMPGGTGWEQIGQFSTIIFER